MDLVLTDQPTAEDEAVVSNGLDDFNLTAGGVQDRKPLAVLLKENGETIGGLTGRTSLGLWFVDLLYLPERLRGSGLGSKILAEAEVEARRRGCLSGVVYTIQFQAPEFYARHGWIEFGRVPVGADRSRVFFRKELRG
ncbi:GNAT family N-acetyltransferase [Kribbella jiaozuonensis]|uniref:GNAT family N-acetyltransferase n=1 Tax=Kribbella jiaozuonensis TaxID=2575441 RepID=A0A4U3LNN7_9ACTN|nr:GNAT family N-acetyltransferase [Kribbella jiaozuonensis]TKK77421.1 GNAT family N-acetyltransferase [Kribbella jiaozuonensis]